LIGGKCANQEIDFSGASSSNTATRSGESYWRTTASLKVPASERCNQGASASPMLGVAHLRAKFASITEFLLCIRRISHSRATQIQSMIAIPMLKTIATISFTIGFCLFSIQARCI
jgi:hypothetical protein